MRRRGQASGGGADRRGYPHDRGLPLINGDDADRLLEIADEFREAEDKPAKRKELSERYPKCESLINISAKCCTYCKKNPAHEAQKGFDKVITGERRDEGGMRSVPRAGDASAMCFTETGNGQYRLRPLYYVSNTDKLWYKDYYGIRYSDAYEVYGLKRTGCCGCPISYRATEDLELIRPYEPKLVQAAWAVFGKSYEFRKRYNRYRDERRRAEKAVPGQISIGDEPL